MTYTLICESCEENKICNLKDGGFTDLCPKIKSKVVETKQTYKEMSGTTRKLEISKEEKDKENEKRRILKDIEKGRGGPDIAGQKRMYEPFESELAKKAKERLVNSF